jgi:hypothetical protein
MSWLFHSSIFWTDFGVLVQEIVERGLEYRPFVPPFIQIPFSGFRASRLDHPKSSVLQLDGLIGPASGLIMTLCRLLGSIVAI